MKHKTCASAYSGTVFGNVYITPPTLFLVLKSALLTRSTSHSGEIPARHCQLAYIPFCSSNTYLQKNSSQMG